MSNNQKEKEDRIVIDWSNLRHNSQKQFGRILRELCEISGFTQGKLAKESKKEKKKLIERGYINPGDFIGSMEQPTISRVLAGSQEPTYFQVFVWLRVVRKHYESRELAEICKKLEMEKPEFSKELEQLLWALTAFRPPEELAQAYEESKNIPPMQCDESIIDHKETRMASRVVDTQFPTLNRANRRNVNTEEISVVGQHAGSD